MRGAHAFAWAPRFFGPARIPAACGVAGCFLCGSIQRAGQPAHELPDLIAHPAVDGQDLLLVRHAGAQARRVVEAAVHPAGTPRKLIVFTEHKDTLDYLTNRISGLLGGHAVVAIHGGVNRAERRRITEEFSKNPIVQVLIATDIAARGIDIDQLDLVINYDLPDVAETYVHRIGRTGRAGNSGRALTFCTQEEQPMLRDIQKLTGRKLPIAN